MTSTPLHYADQLSTLLRSMRKQRRLTQAQLGALLGVSQARVAELEANPGVVGLAQMMKVLAVLGGTLHLSIHDVPALAQTLNEPAPRGGFEASTKPRKGSW